MKSRNLDQYVLLHRSRFYGNTGARMLRYLDPWIRQVKPGSLLDYGAGRGGLVFEVEAPHGAIRHQYDPAIPEISTIPLESYDLILCTDVLEHLDEGEIARVLGEIRSLGGKAILIVGTAPARAFLPNGENAHATVRAAQWWLDEVRRIFPEAQRIPVFRKNRVGIRTWRASQLQSAAALMGVLLATLRQKVS